MASRNGRQVRAGSYHAANRPAADADHAAGDIRRCEARQEGAHGAVFRGHGGPADGDDATPALGGHRRQSLVGDADGGDDDVLDPLHEVGPSHVRGDALGWAAVVQDKDVDATHRFVADTARWSVA
jgi:hypothetical protein